jgi:hypothetical protein
MQKTSFQATDATTQSSNQEENERKKKKFYFIANTQKKKNKQIKMEKYNNRSQVESEHEMQQQSRKH